MQRWLWFSIDVYNPVSVFSLHLECSVILTYGVGLLVPEATAQALKHVLMYKGLAAALVGSLRFIVAAMVGFFMGLVISNSAWPLATTMFSLNILTVLCMVTLGQTLTIHLSDVTSYAQIIKLGFGASPKLV
jgi:hypothetical protein